MKGNMITKCVLCGSERAIVEHHTIPKALKKDWEKTIPLCNNCHHLVHKFILKDIVNWIIELNEQYGFIKESENHDIVWINDIGLYEYLRVTKIIFDKKPTRKEIIKEATKIKKIHKIFAYRFLATDGYIWIYEIYYLKTYDKGCPEEHLGYGKSDKIPAEAVLVKDLLKENHFNRKI